MITQPAFQDDDIHDFENNSSLNECKRTKTNGNKEKKTVSFAPHAEIYYTVSRHNYTEEEMMNSFLTVYDKARIHSDINRTIRTLRSGKSLNCDESYFRGLEGEVGKSNMERKEMLELTYFAIREEQAEHGEIKEIWVEEIYSKITAKSLLAAQKAASWDSQQVKLMLRNENCFNPYSVTI
jgi:hypothetical protein